MIILLIITTIKTDSKETAQKKAVIKNIYESVDEIYPSN